MKITLMMVTSANGKITNGIDADVSRWASKEDQDLFVNTKQKHSLIVMGRRTYEENIHRITPTKHALRIVLTKNSSAFAKNAISGQLEFSDETPEQLIDRLEKIGYTTMLLLGGSELNSAFLRAGLIDELMLTIEPKLFGTGKNLCSDYEFSASMELIKIHQLNANGTLHLTYKILK